MISAVQAKLAITKWRINKGAMVWFVRAEMRIGSKELAGNAHPGDGAFAAHLQGADHLDQAAQKDGLLLFRQGINRREQEV